MANKVTIGSLIVLTSRDTPRAPFAPADVPAPGKDPIEANIPAPDIQRIDFSQHVAAQQPSQDPGPANLPAAQQPSQPVTPVTFSDTIQLVPKVTPTSEAERQASQAVILSRPPAEPVAIPEPTRTKEAAQQPAPDLGRVQEVAFQPVPSPIVLSKPPADVSFVPDISTSKEPAGVTFLPDVSLSKSPAEPITVAEPPKTVVAADQPAPPISLTSPAAQQQSQDITLSKEPAKPIDVPEPSRTVVAAEQKSQDISLSSPPAEPIKLDEPPKTVVAASQPTPDISPSKAPADPIKLDDFPRTAEAAPQKSPDLGKLKDLEFQPPPPLSAPAELAFEPAPPPLFPAVLPPPPDFSPNPNAVLPAEPAPPPSKPADLPAPPDFKPAPNAALPDPPDFKPAPNATLPAEPAPPPSAPAVLPAPPNFAPNPNATLPGPPNFAPNPNATLPAPPPVVTPPTSVAGLQSPAGTDRIGKDPYAPGGQLDSPKDVLGSLARVDAKVKDFLNTLNPYSDIGSSEPGGQAMNPVLYAKSLVRLGTQVGATGLALFGATQLGLFALNREGKLWNPLTTDPIPLTEGFVPAAIDALFNKHEQLVVHEHQDRLKDLGDGVYNDAQVVSYPPFVAATILGGSVAALKAPKPEPRLVGAASQDPDISLTNPLVLTMSTRDALIQTKNAYTPDAKYEENADSFFSMSKLVGTTPGEGTSALLIDDTNTGLKKVDITKMYIPTPKLLTGGKGMGFDPDKNAAPLSLLGGGNNAFADATLKGAFYPSGVVPASLDPDVETGGFLALKQNDNPSKVIADDAAYVPLSFMDMRPDAGNNVIKCVYFRPFITNLSEEFSPEWNKQNYFGRVDPVCSYMSTGRTINIGFIVHAFSPEDLEVIYQKLNWLTSMVYPEYDKDLLFKGGPMVRMRVGDLIKSAGGLGLPGIIENLSIDYNEVVWELAQGNKAPMGFKVGMTFQVLHDTPIGKGLNGRFGAIGTIKEGKFQPPASAKDATAKAPELSGEAAGRFRGMGSTMNDDIPEK